MGNCSSAAVVLRHLAGQPWAESSCPALCPVCGTQHKEVGCWALHHLLSSFCNGYEFPRTNISLFKRYKAYRPRKDKCFYFVSIVHSAAHREWSTVCTLLSYRAHVKTALLISHSLPTWAATFFTLTTWSSSTALALEENVVRSIHSSSTDT